MIDLTYKMKQDVTTKKLTNSKKLLDYLQDNDIFQESLHKNHHHPTQKSTTNILSYPTTSNSHTNLNKTVNTFTKLDTTISPQNDSPQVAFAKDPYNKYRNSVGKKSPYV